MRIFGPFLLSEEIMITFKKDGAIESITFYEDGWYDCCSGHWFISYHLLDSEGERIASYNNISECHFIALKIAECHSMNSSNDVLKIAERHSMNSSNDVLKIACQGNYGSELDLINLFDEATVVDVLGRELEDYEVNVVIKLDESIDLNYSITCYD